MGCLAGDLHVQPQARHAPAAHLPPPTLRPMRPPALGAGHLLNPNARRGEVSRARGVLTCAVIAPGTEETFAALSDPARRPPAPRQDVPADVLYFQPDSPVVLTDAAVAQALRTARRGTDQHLLACLLALLDEEDDADPEVADARRLAMLPS
ncbi:unnamed protein product, partial [Symbiodinium sp. CCMP2456]